LIRLTKHDGRAVLFAVAELLVLCLGLRHDTQVMYPMHPRTL